MKQFAAAVLARAGLLVPEPTLREERSTHAALRTPQHFEPSPSRCAVSRMQSKRYARETRRHHDLIDGAGEAARTGRARRRPSLRHVVRHVCRYRR